MRERAHSLDGDLEVIGEHEADGIGAQVYILHPTLQIERRAIFQQLGNYVRQLLQPGAARELRQRARRLRHRRL